MDRVTMHIPSIANLKTLEANVYILSNVVPSTLFRMEGDEKERVSDL